MSDRYQIRLTTYDTDVAEWERKLNQLAQALKREFNDKVSSVDGAIVYLKASAFDQAKSIVNEIDRYLKSDPGKEKTARALETGGKQYTGYFSRGRDPEHSQKENRVAQCFTFRLE